MTAKNNEPGFYDEENICFINNQIVSILTSFESDHKYKCVIHFIKNGIHQESVETLSILQILTNEMWPYVVQQQRSEFYSERDFILLQHVVDHPKYVKFLFESRDYLKSNVAVN
jgi:hypothetical protein